MKPITRRTMLTTTAIGAGGTLAGLAGCERAPVTRTGSAAVGGRPSADEEYVWISANANLPLFTSRDHPALRLAAEHYGVRVKIAGPNSLDIPGLITTIDQSVALRPAGIMVVGWDSSALVSPINRAIEAGVPVVCVDADVPASTRISFIGTNWYELGVRQAEGMIQALKGRTGKVALIGLIDQQINQDAFEGFRSVAIPAGLTTLAPQHDRGNQVEAYRVASALIQAHPDLIGIAGFDSESGPGMGQALKEAGKAGTIVATCVDDQAQHLQLCREGVLSTLIGQKRELFTWIGVQALLEINHSPLLFTTDDRALGLYPVPNVYHTGSYTITRENVDRFLN